jgi:hypothetical protein
VLSLALAACGDDDDGGEDASATTTTEAAADNEELCTLAEEIFEQDDFPSAAQIERYTELAPDEIQGAIAIAGPPIIAADGDLQAGLLAQADDEVEDAIFDIDEFERETCGIDHEPRYPPEANEVDPDATRVDVAVVENADGTYSFDFDAPVPAGPVSFVLTNSGEEVHFMAFSQINEGHTLDEALAFEGDPDAEGITSPVEYDSGLAAPGGEDEEAVTLDLEAGDYAMLCFIPGPDGTPHFANGMAVPFEVS